MCSELLPRGGREMQLNAEAALKQAKALADQKEAENLEEEHKGLAPSHNRDCGLVQTPVRTSTT